MIDFGDIEASEAYNVEASLASDWELRAARSAGERAKPPVPWPSRSGKQEAQARPRGIFYGLEFPTSASELEASGVAWLNDAFRVAGSLPKGTEVAAIKSVKWLGTRDAVSRLLLHLEYAPCRGALDTLLLAKLPLPSAEALLPPSPCSALALEDWIAEINCYRLLETATPLGMPRYYFGDVGSGSAEFIIITQWVPGKGDGDWSAWVHACQHVDLATAPLSFWEDFMRACGSFAGSCKAGRLDPQMPKRAATVAEPPSKDGSEEWLGVGDVDWAVQAAMVQEFVMTSGRRLFPSYTRTPEAMTSLRKCLLAGRNNAAVLAWWFQLRPDYLGVGLDRLDLDSLFLQPGVGSEEGGSGEGAGAEQRLCVKDWAGVSEGCLGQRLFSWLMCAKREVLQRSLLQLLEIFSEAWHASGGPKLEITTLRLQFVMAVVVQCERLVGQMEQLYKWCPKDQWSSIKSLSDERLCSCTSTQGSLWRFVRCFVNVTVLIQHFDFADMVERLMPEILSEHSLGRPLSKESPEAIYCVRREGAAVFAEATGRSTLVARLPLRTYLFADAGALRPDPERPKVTWTQVNIPTPGWICTSDIREELPLPTLQDNGCVNKKAYAEMELFGLMHHARRQYTGYNPQGTCITSAMMLRTEVLTRSKTMNTLEDLGRGPCGVYLGSFLAERTPRPWWPKGYKDWLHHSFLVFQDGSIADITADQFDNVPQLWFPADSTRYSNDCCKADEALKMREAFGLERWQELAQFDNTVVAKTRLKWTEAEAQRRGKSAQADAAAEAKSEAKKREVQARRQDAGDGATSTAKAYHFVGDSNGWKKPLRPMATRLSGAGGQQLVHRVVLKQGTGIGLLGASVRREEFQILRNGDWNRRVFPCLGGPGPKVALLWAGGPASQAACGEKKDQGHGRNWALEGQVGDAIDVVYGLEEGAVWLEEVA